MSLFGNSFDLFKNRFTKLFHIEYQLGCIRLRDLVTKSCIINIRLPFIISEEYQDLLTSLYIQIFKHPDSFYLRYDQEDFQLYNTVREIIDKYMEIHQKREQLTHQIYKKVTNCSIERSNNLFFNRSPSNNLKMNVDKVYQLNKRVDAINYKLLETSHPIIQ